MSSLMMYNRGKLRRGYDLVRYSAAIFCSIYLQRRYHVALLSFHNAVSPIYVGHPSSAMSLGHSVAILVDAFWYDDQRNAALVKEPVALVYYLNAVRCKRFN